MFNTYLEKIVNGKHLELNEMETAMRMVMEGNTTNSQLAGFLVGLRMKGESIEEITAAARVMRKKAISISSQQKHLVDTCGTGGDGKGTFNISTTVALILAGADLPVAKHGNRSVSSKSGSADVLESLGVKLDITPEQVQKCLDEVGIGFLFAPAFHKAMKYAIGPRKELGIRTIFNVLGPLTNPARARYQVMGVYHPGLVEPLAKVLQNLGVKEAMVVHGGGGIDEFSLSGENKVAHLQDDKIKHFTIAPEEIGFNRVDIKKLAGGSPGENKEIIISILNGKKGPRREVVVFNAAAALIVTGLVSDWFEGKQLAENIIDSKVALNKLKELIEFTNSFEVVS